MNKILSLRLSGGLGNQLFEIVSAKSLCSDFGFHLTVDTSAYKRYNLHPFISGPLFPDISWNKCTPRSYFPLQEVSPGFDISLLNKLRYLSCIPFSRVVLIGYLQSLSYFAHHLSAISSDINSRLQSIFSSENLAINEFLSQSLGVHVRRGDKLSVLNKSIYGTTDIEYLLSSISSVFSKSSCSNIVLFGDDPTYLSNLAETLNLSIPTKSFSSLSKFSSPLFDFFSLSRCHTLYLSNSTFALWSAYISPSQSIYFPSPFYPYPRHHSVSTHLLEDFIVPSWSPYDSSL